MSRELMKLALEELQNARDHIYLLPENEQPLTEEQILNRINAAITVLHQEVYNDTNDKSQKRAGQQEPVCWTVANGWVYANDTSQVGTSKEVNWEPLYTAPPKSEWVGLTEREVELIDEMIETQLLHAERCDHMANSTMAQKQKAWDLERVELLRKLKERNT